MRVVFNAADLSVNLASLQTGFTAIADRFRHGMADARPRHAAPGDAAGSPNPTTAWPTILYRWRTGELEMIPTAIVSNHPRETYGGLDFG